MRSRREAGRIDRRRLFGGVGLLAALLLASRVALAEGVRSPEAVPECRWDGPTLLIDPACAFRLARQNSFEILDQETYLRGAVRHEALAAHDFAIQMTPTFSAVTLGNPNTTPLGNGGTGTQTASTDLYRSGLRFSKRFGIGTSVAVEPFYEWGSGNQISGLLVGVTQPLLRGVAPVYVESTLDAASSQTKVSGLSQVQSCLVTLLGVVDQLSTLTELQERHRLFSEALLSMETKLTITEARERAGLASSLDVLRTKIERTNLRDLVASVSDQLGDAADRLRFLLRLPPGLPIRGLVSPRDAPGPPEPDGGVAARLDVRIAAEGLSEARRQVRVSRHAILPDLNATFTMSLQGGKTEYSIPSLPTWTLSISSSGELGRPAERAAYQDALDRVEVAARALVQTQERARDEVRSLGRQLDRLKKQEAIQREQIEQAAAKLAIAEAKFRNGLASNFDFLEAETELRNAQVALLSAQRDLVPSAHRLLNGTGRYDVWLKESYAVDCAAPAAPR
ncbi:MAG TPA: TolC family protein [Thermoanaerobaculia bacterium]|nr:TolC family protein [Thermoanaerobaculia bacterium]